MASAQITTTLDQAGWRLETAVRGRSCRNGRAIRDLKADWRRWSAGERTAVLVIAAIWSTAFFALVATSGT